METDLFKHLGTIVSLFSLFGFHFRPFNFPATRFYSRAAWISMALILTLPPWSGPAGQV